MTVVNRAVSFVRNFLPWGILNQPPSPGFRPALISGYVFGAVNYATYDHVAFRSSAGSCLRREQVLVLCIASTAALGYIHIGRPHFLNGVLQLDFGCGRG